MKTYNYRKFAKLLKKNGFYIHRQGKGNHVIFRHKDGREAVVPNRSGDICIALAQRLIKENNLKV